MDFILEIVELYAPMWGPALAAILGTVLMVITAINKVKTALDELHQDETIKNLKEDVKKQLEATKRQEQLIKLLLDNLTKVHGYSEERLREIIAAQLPEERFIAIQEELEKLKEGGKDEENNPDKAD